MKFVQDYRDDCDTLLRAWRDREPFAFARFGDGEAFILAGNEGFNVENLETESWRSGDVTPEFRERLLAAISHDEEGYHVGLFARRKARDRWKWYAKYVHEPVRVPRERRTFAEVFSYRNWGKFTPEDCRGCVLVCSKPKPDLPDVEVLLVPRDDAWKLDPADAVQALLEKDKPVLVAAGPLGSVLVHEYWRQGGRNPIMNIGSIFDPQIHGQTTRNYHNHIPGVLEFAWPQFGELR